MPCAGVFLTWEHGDFCVYITVAGSWREDSGDLLNFDDAVRSQHKKRASELVVDPRRSVVDSQYRGSINAPY